MGENVHKTALASLTATYTDSEGESDPSGTISDDEAPRPVRDEQTANINRGYHQIRQDESSSHSAAGPLVSYHGDDDEDPEQSFNSFEAHNSPGSNTSNDQPGIIRMEVSNSGSPIGISQPQSPVSYHRSLSETGVLVLPAEPLGQCSKELQTKIANLYSKTKEGIDMNATIQKRKDFRNPSIYEKLIQFCSIDELGTNFPPEVYDPHMWGKESYYEELAKRQKEEVERREKERKTKVEFISGTAKKTDDKQRKSKWDTGPVATNLPAPGVVSVPTGTKPTVISAFGVLPKKSGKP